MMKKFRKLSEEVENLIKSTENDAKKNYTKAYRGVRDRLNAIYLKYAALEGVSLLDFMKKSEIRKLDRATASALVDMYKANKDVVNNILEDIFNKAFEESIQSVEKYNLSDVKRYIDPTSVINREIAGHIWTDRIDKRSRDFIYDIHGIVHKGLADGDTFTTMAKNLKKKFGRDIGNTMRIARTEGARVLEDAKYEAFKSFSENKNVQVFKIWRTMGDEAVRDSHVEMEGQKVLFDEPFKFPSGVTAMYPKASGVPGEDINCRCYVEYVTEIRPDEEIEALNVASKSLEDIKLYESEITSNLKDIESAVGSKLEGLDFRLKSEESFARKIISDAKEKNINFSKAAEEINDKLRYTFVNSEEVFTDKYFKAVDELHKRGYNIIRVKNTFKDGVVYKGINTLVKSKDNVVFELQYHTPKSLEIKEGGLHELYEKQRVLDKIKDKERWDKLEEEMIKLSDTIPIPKNVRRIELNEI